MTGTRNTRKAFQTNVRKRFGADYPAISDLTMQSYQGVHLWAKGVEKAGTLDRMKVVVSRRTSLITLRSATICEAAPISRATSVVLAALRPTITTRAPSPASVRAATLPMPLVAPVTSTVLPAMLPTVAVPVAVMEAL